MNWTTIREYRTRHFTTRLQWQYEEYPDVSWADAPTLRALERGDLVNVCFRVVVYCDGREVGSDYLGNSVYRDPADFAREHLDPDPMHRNCSLFKAKHPNTSICIYYPDMLRIAIAEARKALTNVPRLRSV